MEEKELSQNREVQKGNSGPEEHRERLQRQQKKRKKRRKPQSRRSRKAQRKKKRMLLLLGEAAAVLILFLMLFAVIFRGCGDGNAVEPAAVIQGAGMQNLELFRQATSEVMAEETEEEEERVSTVKVIDTETDEVTLGIDVSEYQGNIDWSQAAEGQDFVMVRVGYRSSETGEITEDACARYNLQEAGAQGLYLGAYFFSTAVSEEEAREEAGWVCDLLDGYSITYPVAYNCEGFADHRGTVPDRPGFPG